MTEDEWLTCADPSLMFIHVHKTVTARKLRLFTCACCRRIWVQIADTLHRNAVELGERFADGDITEDKRDRTHSRIRAAMSSRSPRWVYAVAECVQKELGSRTHELGMQAVASAGSGKYTAGRRFVDSTGRPPRFDQERAMQADLVRDIFANPFRPADFDPSWRTGNVLTLAQTTYEERAFERLPILADALMDAGCNQEEILQHCRSEGQHVRGCWVVDLVLEKA